MNKKGVTLIELIVVMVIIAIGAVLFTPNIGGWMGSYNLRSATRNLASTMRTAQMKAVSTNMAYRVSFRQAPPSYILQYENPPPGSGNWVTEGTTQTLPSGISISVINFAGNNAVFNPNSTSSRGSITLQGAKGAKIITLNAATGRVTIK